jgi:hypothetical protein
MKTFRFALSALLIGASAALMSCGDPSPVGPRTSSVAPSVAPQADLLSPVTSLLKKTGLIACSPLPYARTTKTIGPEGGVINVGPHSLTVPAGALRRSVTITATAPSGKYNHVDFQPEGLEFRTSASLTMSYANCNLLGTLLPKRIAYTNDDLTKIYYYLLSLDDLLGNKVTGKVDHFSDYAVSW